MSNKIKVVALIAAAGAAARFGGNKLYKKLPSGETLMGKSLRTFAAHPQIDKVMAVINPKDRPLYQKQGEGLGALQCCDGGGSRGESVANGIKAIAEAAKTEGGEPKYILIHDAARGFVAATLITRIIAALNRGKKAVVPSLAVTDTLRRVSGGEVSGGVGKTVTRDGLVAAQTPQGFDFATLRAAVKPPFAYTDEAAATEASGVQTALVEGQEDNIKVTTEGDWSLATALDNRLAAVEPRNGYGFDVHRLVDGKAMTLCGVRIVGKHMLAGHSDADVACHALTDAILGALALGDIGTHFPSTELRWKNADSLRFLRFAVEKVAEYRGRFTNVDVTLVCESPKITPLRAEMVQKLAEVLRIEPSRINVKSTTTEGLGFTGRSEGIAAHAVVGLLLPSGREDVAVQL